MNKLINAVGFQAGWWACVAGVGLGLEVEAMLFCCVLVLAHWRWSSSALQEMKLGGVALLVGVLVDSMLQYVDVIDFYGWALGALSPFWLWTLWLLFACTLNGSLAFLKQMPRMMSACVGLVFGPLTYYAGAQLGAASLHVSLLHMACLGLAWMLALPLLLVLAQRIAQTSEENAR